MRRFSDLSLGGRVFILLGLLLLLTGVGSVGTIFYAVRMNSLFNRVVERDVASLHAASELSTALVNQKGFATYYFLDGDPRWLEQLGQHRQAFRMWLAKARELETQDQGKQILDRIETSYNRYIEAKNEVITLYQSGRRDEGARRHRDVREMFFPIYDLCGQYEDIQESDIELAKAQSAEDLRKVTVTALAILLGILLLAGIFAFVLINQILEPIRRLASEASGTGVNASRDNIAVLRDSFHGLKEDRDHTLHELERSRARLVSSEKMAVVGRLAAGVAHSIRNPMTSIKMRLFSLERGLALSVAQKEDFEVVSEELRRLDNIVSNFLEFSRPHRLKMQRINASDVVDMALELLHHRLEMNRVRVKRERPPDLPPVDADPELLKEVLVNLIVNACEAMNDGGMLTIDEDEAVAEEVGRVVRIRVADNGPGIPPDLLGRIMEPFYTTKEEGTGLGLSIVSRIIEEHGGRLEVSSSEEGAVFVVTLPLRECG